MSSPIQNGKVNRPRFASGEGLTFEDLNSLSAIPRAYVNDLVLGAIMRKAANQIGPQGGSAPQLYALGHSGAPMSPVGNLIYGCNPGPLFYAPSSPAVDGLTPKVLTYYLALNEITGALAAGDATFPRFDAVYVRISEVDGSTELRDFKDAVTGVVTSQSVAPAKQTKLEWTVVQGMPAAMPQVPAAPDATWAPWGVWYVSKGWTGSLGREAGGQGIGYVFDYRIPIGYKRYGVDVNGIWAASSSPSSAVSPADGAVTFSDTTANARIGASCPVKSGRIMAVAWETSFSDASSIGRLRVTYGNGSTPFTPRPPFYNRSIYSGSRPGDPTIADNDVDKYTIQNGLWLNNGTIQQTTAGGLQLLPLWANGYGSEADDPAQAGGIGGTLSGQVSQDKLNVWMEWKPANTLDTVIGCVWDIAG